MTSLCYFTMRLGKWLKDSLTYPSKLGTRLERKEINFYLNLASGFGVVG